MKMKRYLFLSLLIIFFTTSFIFLVGCNNQKSTKEQSTNKITEEYDLREKCEKQSEEWFKNFQQNYPGDKLTYKSHYNMRLNKCFIYTTWFQSGGYQIVLVSDVYKKKNYGSCCGAFGEDDFSCVFLNKNMNDKKEWDELVKPYMEE